MDNLQISPDGQYAFLNIDMNPCVYNEDYFSKYEKYENTTMGVEISEYRCRMARDYGDSVIDVGIGSGHFLETCILAGMRACGYDVNPVGVAWLQERGLYHDPYVSWPDANVLTLWDVLEHLRRPDDLLRRVPGGAVVVMTIPVYSGRWEDLASWKHYREDEHHWYFRHEGIVNFMVDRGYEPIVCGDGEVELGREDVRTYAFERV